MRGSLYFALVVPLVGVSACSSDSGPGPGLPESGVRDAGNQETSPPSGGGRDVSPPPPTPVPEAGPDAMPDAHAEYPERLSETGLYADITTGTLADGVRAFEPRYALWSDGATKRRFLYLPEGEKIDTSDMDFWTYPVGTTAWKEFTRNGVRVETRMLRKNGPGDWAMIAYQWRPDHSDAIAVPAGLKNANGTPHDIPAQKDCVVCHRHMKDVLLGVSAIQLSYPKDAPGLTIDDLTKEKRLTVRPTASFQIPGDEVAEGALGYLHANCGLCHNSQAKDARLTPLQLWESTDKLDLVEHTLGYETTVGAASSFLPDLHVIEPGHPDDSVLVIRMSERGTRQMPPIATEVVDEDAVANIRAWVEALGIRHDGGVPEGGIHEGGIHEGGTHEAGISDGGIHE